MTDTDREAAEFLAYALGTHPSRVARMMSRRCEETVMRGVPAGPATCDRPLDERGQCDRASGHVE